MEKIEAKTKIKKLELGCRKQHIEFKAFDMTSRQVSHVDKLIRNNDNEYIKLTIAPEVERLEIPPIDSVVKLVAMECAGKGQHIKIAGFHASGDKLDIINNYINNESDVLVTFEQTQEKLIEETPPEDPEFDRGQDARDTDDFDNNDPPADGPLVREYNVNENGVITNPEVITIKLPKSHNASCSISIGKSNGEWYYGYDITVGHAGVGSPCKNYGGLEVDETIQSGIACLIEFIDEQTTFKYVKQTKAKIEKEIDKWLSENN